MKLEEIKKNINEQLPFIKDKYKVKSIGIFGSFVKEEQKTESDVDILVEFYEPVSLFKFIDLADFLEERLSLKVALVTKKALKPVIRDKILNEVVYL